MIKLLKSLLLFSSCLLFISCSSNTNYIKLSNINIKVDNKNKQINSCINNSFTSFETNNTYGKLFIENINISSTCFWNTLPRSSFEDLFKNTLNINSMKIVERYDYDNYEFTTYRINNSYINLIYNFKNNDDTFILDYKGILSNELIKQYDKNYKSKYINKKRYIKEYNNSLVKMSFVNDYFKVDIDKY